YDTHASDNEPRSAAYARQLLEPLLVPPEEREETARLILLTQTHQTEESDRAGLVLLDADLAILGADRADYDDYSEAIRREYAWVPQPQYREGRRQVLERFLARPRIFRTSDMHGHREAKARENLAREMASLSR